MKIEGKGLSIKPPGWGRVISGRKRYVEKGAIESRHNVS